MKRIALTVAALVLLVAVVWLAHGAMSDDPAAATTASPSSRSAPSASPATTATTTPRPQARPQLARTASPGLDVDLRDADPQVRRNAVAEVAASDHPDPQLLLGASRDGDLGVAVVATEGLGKLYRNGEITARDLAARTDPSVPERVRVTALNGLGLVQSPDSASILVDQLAHGDPINKRSAAILLQHQDPAVAVPALITALSDADTMTRTNAHDSLVALARGRDLGTDASAWSAWWAQRR
jgi:HEAT repeat protein